MSISDLFGFLPFPQDIDFEGGKIELLERYEEKQNRFASLAHKDGLIYPSHISNNPESYMLRLPPSHQITFYHVDTLEQLRNEDGIFLIYLAGYLFGYRLQISEWYFDGFINTKSNHYEMIWKPEVASEFLSTSYKRWKSWKTINQKRIINICYMLSRSISYFWPWERFFVLYTIFDACYRIASEEDGIVAKSHYERLISMSDKYEIVKDDDLFERIYNLRNGLFHESLWNGQIPGYGGDSEKEVFLLERLLKRFIQRMILALLGTFNKYTHGKWNKPFDELPIWR